MKHFRFSKVYEYAIYCDVEAETVEEAKQLAEEAEWENDEGGEHWIVLDRWKCSDGDEDALDDADWVVTYDANSRD